MESQTYTAKTVILVQNVDLGHPLPEHFRIEESQLKASDLTEGGILF